MNGPHRLTEANRARTTRSRKAQISDPRPAPFGDRAHQQRGGNCVCQLLSGQYMTIRDPQVVAMFHATAGGMAPSYLCGGDRA